MPSFLEPDPILLAFSAVKEWIYLLVLAVFALLRSVVGLFRPAPRLAHVLTFGGLALTLLFLGSVVLVPVLGVSSGPAFLISGLVGGVGVPLVCSGVLLAAAPLPKRKFWVLDGLHVIGVCGFLGLFGYAVFS